MAALSNISTFDNVTQTLKMFDSDDAQILGLTAMLLVADTIALILEQPTQPNTTRLRQKAQDSTASAPRSFPRGHFEADGVLQDVRFTEAAARFGR